MIFAHGRGSSRFSPRNRLVAGILQQAGSGTRLFDLLTPEEDQLYENRFHIELIPARLVSATEWLAQPQETRELAFGFLGAGTGAAAAMKAAARLGSRIKALVSRGAGLYTPRGGEGRGEGEFNLFSAPINISEN